MGALTDELGYTIYNAGETYSAGTHERDWTQTDETAARWPRELEENGVYFDTGLAIAGAGTTVTIAAGTCWWHGYRHTPGADSIGVAQGLTVAVPGDYTIYYSGDAASPYYATTGPANEPDYDLTVGTAVVLSGTVHAVNDHWKRYKQSDIRAIAALAAAAGTSSTGVGVHNVLSASHTDTAVATPATGDVIARASTGKWTDQKPHRVSAQAFAGADIGAQVNAAFAAGVRNVYIPGGVHVYATQIVLPDACTLTGVQAGNWKSPASTECTHLEYEGAGPAIVCGSATGYSYMMHLSNMWIERTTGATDADAVVEVCNSHHGVFENLIITSTDTDGTKGTDGLRLCSRGVYTSYYNIFSNMRIREIPGTGLHLTNYATGHIHCNQFHSIWTFTCGRSWTPALDPAVYAVFLEPATGTVNSNYFYQLGMDRNESGPTACTFTDATDQITIATTTGWTVGEVIYFSGANLGNVIASTHYYVQDVVDEYNLKISATLGGGVFDLGASGANLHWGVIPAPLRVEGSGNHFYSCRYESAGEQVEFGPTGGGNSMIACGWTGVVDEGFRNLFMREDEFWTLGRFALQGIGNTDLYNTYADDGYKKALHPHPPLDIQPGGTAAGYETSLGSGALRCGDVRFFRYAGPHGAALTLHNADATGGTHYWSWLRPDSVGDLYLINESGVIELQSKGGADDGLRLRSWNNGVTDHEYDYFLLHSHMTGLALTGYDTHPVRIGNAKTGSPSRPYLPTYVDTSNDLFASGEAEFRGTAHFQTFTDHCNTGLQRVSSVSGTGSVSIIPSANQGVLIGNDGDTTYSTLYPRPGKTLRLSGYTSGVRIEPSAGYGVTLIPTAGGAVDVDYNASGSVSLFRNTGAYAAGTGHGYSLNVYNMNDAAVQIHAGLRMYASGTAELSSSFGDVTLKPAASSRVTAQGDFSAGAHTVFAGSAVFSKAGVVTGTRLTINPTNDNANDGYPLTTIDTPMGGLRLSTRANACVRIPERLEIGPYPSSANSIYISVGDLNRSKTKSGAMQCFITYDGGLASVGGMAFVLAYAGTAISPVPQGTIAQACMAANLPTSEGYCRVKAGIWKAGDASATAFPAGFTRGTYDFTAGEFSTMWSSYPIHGGSAICNHYALRAYTNVDRTMPTIYGNYAAWLGPPTGSPLGHGFGGDVKIANDLYVDGKVYHHGLVIQNDVKCLGDSVTEFEVRRTYRNPVETFSGTGVIRLIAGEHTCAADTAYVVEIDGAGAVQVPPADEEDPPPTPATYRWSETGGASWAGTSVIVSPRVHDLNNSIQIMFAGAGTTGDFYAGDSLAWTAIGTPNQVIAFKVDTRNNRTYAYDLYSGVGNFTNLSGGIQWDALSPNPPFTVLSSVVVPGFNADLLDGNHAAAFAGTATAATISGQWDFSTGPRPDMDSVISLGDDTHHWGTVYGNALSKSDGAGHEMRTVPGKDSGVTLTAMRNLYLFLGADADATLNMAGSACVSQDYRATASPTWNRVALTQATGTAPLTVASTTKVANLGADLWDDQHFSTAYAPAQGDVMTYHAGTSGWVARPAAAGGSYEPVIVAGGTTQYWCGDKSWRTLNQAAVAGLTVTDSPTFLGLTLTNAVQWPANSTYKAKFIADATGVTLTADRTMTLRIGSNANALLAVTGTGGKINQDLRTTASPVFVKTQYDGGGGFNIGETWIDGVGLSQDAVVTWSLGLDVAAVGIAVNGAAITLGGDPLKAYTTSNVTEDRTYNAHATTTDELADVLGTLIADLKTFGIIQ